MNFNIANSSKPEALDYYYIAPAESLFFDGYKEVRYSKLDSAGNVISITNVLRIFKNNNALITVNEGVSIVEDLCEYLPYIKDNCYLQDINRDDLKEMIIGTFTGGANCCYEAKIFCANDSLMQIFEIEPNLRDFDLKDLENDSIPEFIYCDMTFSYWKDRYRWYLPPLIWRWDGTKYRIANFRFSDYIIKTIFPADDVWASVIFYNYAGKFAEADSIFNIIFPQNSLQKDEEYKAFKKQLYSDSLWAQIMESNW